MASAVSTPSPHRPLALLALGVALVVLGVRWSILHRFGYDVPFWPEWMGAGYLLFKPWLEGQFTWDHLFSLHNEHRHVLPRLWSLGFFAANGRWDPMLVQAANALVSALNAGLLVWFAGRVLPDLSLRWLLLTAAVALLVPFDYADLLVSYPAEYFFYITLTLGAIACWTAETLTPVRLVGGVMCGLLASLTVAAGPLVPLSLLACLIWRHGTLPSQTRLWAYALLGFALLGAWLLRPHSMDGFASPPIVAASAGRYLAWPASNLVGLLAEWPESARYVPRAIAQFPTAESPWIGAIGGLLARERAVEIALLWLIALILFAPTFLLLRRAARDGPARAPRFLTILAIWVFLNIGAMSLVRNEIVQGRLIPPRFQDILALSLLINFSALAYAWRTSATSTAHRWRRAAAGVFIVITIGSVAITAAGIFLAQLPRKRAENAAAATLIQTYLRTGDAKTFLDQPVNHVPWPGGEHMLPKVLNDATLRPVLPVGLYPEEARPELPRLSRFSRGVLALGWLPGLLGLGCILVALRARSHPASVHRAPVL